jgi:type IV pilus assembly protein PilY1
MPITLHHHGLLKRMFVCMAATLAIASNARAVTPEIGIADTPLYGAHTNVHPNMVLSLSVEYPTVGVAYRSDNGTYNKTTEYVGYFHPLKCYVYQGGNRNVTTGYFAVMKDANAVHECGGNSFSGNFMNWVASSAIDMMRYALTGGDRVVDTESMTILQRAVLPSLFYANDNYFPRRSVTESQYVSAPNQITPFNVSTLYVVSCSNHILFSDIIGLYDDCEMSSNYGDTDEYMARSDRRLGEYLVRVRVCDDSEGPVRTDLCKRYGNHYKPIGDMQRNADKIRFAVMGYLRDDYMTRYGGVLRAPMKYVGASKYEQPGFAEQANDKREWDPLTGIFLNDSESAANGSNVISSGVINYLNQFGRGGEYKTFDPVGELYYEAIRYLQGKQPTSQALADLQPQFTEGFPVIGKWSDPIIASCQKNFIVSIADVNTHFDRYIPGNTRETMNDDEYAFDSKRAVEAAVAGKTPELNVMTWTRKVGEMEADVSDIYHNPSPRSNLANLDKLDTGYQGHGTYYMAGLAYWANTQHIRLDKPIYVQTFTIDVDELGNGSVDNNFRDTPSRNSQLYLAAKYGGFIDANDDGNPFVTSNKNGENRTVTTIQNNEWDADGDGTPDNYFLAGNPRALIGAIHKIFADVPNSSGSISGVAVSGTRVLADGGYVYQPGFDSNKWSGILKRFKIELNTNHEIILATVSDWDAGDVLTGSDPSHANPLPAARRIYTAYTAADKSFSTLNFEWSSLAVAQRALLNTSPATGVADGLGEQRVAYLRGVRTMEEGANGGVFRARARVLGDIIHSNPVYVGAPSLNTNGAGFTEFYDARKERTKAVYVGANDGMLHAFDASNGQELFAYVPEMLLSQLNRLTAPAYAHQPYVDGVIVTADAKVGSRWRTVLVSGMGGSAQGVFALDITNPSAFSETNGALWEFSDSDDADIGNVIGTPVIAKFRTGTEEGVAQYRYFAVVANGFNNYRNDGAGKYNSAAPGVLFLLALDKSAAEPWTQGSNYFKFVMPISDATLQNGLSSPAVVVGSDGAVRYVYAGDVQGNLWRLNFTGDAPWSSALGTTPYKPLFVARDQNGTRQPITVQPKVVFAPDGYVVLFGTGKFVENSDVSSSNFKRQSFYGIHDTTNDEDKLTNRTFLVPRVAELSADGKTLNITGDAFVYGTTTGTYRGWYLDFKDAQTTGERSVTNPLAIYGRVFFNTLIPSVDPCAIGSGRSYALDALSGLTVDGETTGGLSSIGFLGAPMLLDAGEADSGDRNSIGRRPASRQYSIFNFGTDGAVKERTSRIYPPAGRFSWREVLNWQELRNAITK